MKILLCFLAMATLVSFAAAPDATGKWAGTWTPEGQDSRPAYAVLKQAGSSLTGTAGPDADTQWAISDGKVSGNTVSLQVTDPDGVVYKVTMSLNGDKLNGDIQINAGGQTAKAKIELARQN